MQRTFTGGTYLACGFGAGAALSDPVSRTGNEAQPAESHANSRDRLVDFRRHSWCRFDYSHKALSRVHRCRLLVAAQ
jgi:hypothetical protein